MKIFSKFCYETHLDDNEMFVCLNLFITYYNDLYDVNYNQMKIFKDGITYFRG